MKNKGKVFVIYQLAEVGRIITAWDNWSCPARNCFKLKHGENDTIVSPTHLLESKEYLTNHGIKVKTKLFKNCEHKIPLDGASLGLAFLIKNLLYHPHQPICLSLFG